MNNKNWTTITKEASLDITWFVQFATLSNGVSFFGSCRPVHEIECDACLTGGGGHSSRHFYISDYAPDHAEKYGAIHRLEAINLLVAYKTLMTTSTGAGYHVNIYTDNISSAFSLMSGKTKDDVLGSCARQMWLEAAWRDHTFTISHKPGSQLTLADALSRYATDDKYKILADNIVRERKLAQVEPILSNYAFFDTHI